MIDDKDFDALLSRALSRSGEPAPFSVDVASRVMARVAELGPPPRTEMSGRQFGRWAAAASIGGLALTVAAALNGPSMEAALSFLLHTMADATGAALKLTGPANSFAAALGRVATALVTSARTLAGPLTPFQPLAQALLAGVALAMLSVTSFVLGRDLLGRAADMERA